MRISTKGRYGLRLMVGLASHESEGPVSVDVLSKEQSVSANYIHVLMGSLTAAGLARSMRGPNGGYQLSRGASEISALDVVRALEGMIEPVECVVKPGKCVRAADCTTREVWSKVANAVENVLGGLTLDKLARSGVHNEYIDYSI